MDIPYQIIPYCIRSLNFSNNSLINNETHIIHGTSITFETLQQNNITSEKLYLSFAPIDVVERYQAFLENPHLSSSMQIFYNCSIPWFGEFCQYTFNSTLTFKELVSSFSSAYSHNYLFQRGPCYTFLKCDRGSASPCLDWREICDGKIDCLDGGNDEFGCEELITNECKEDEFRCSNGFCIPKEFFSDETFGPDCMDSSDEISSGADANNDYQRCELDPSFRCEERTCRNERWIPCANGDCSVKACTNNRHLLLLQAKLSRNANSHLSFDCWISMICLSVYFDNRFDLVDEMKCREKNISESLFRQNCPTFFFFPAQSIILNHVRFAYEKNFTNKYRYNLLLPHYVCYDQQLCEWLPATILKNNLTCRTLSELNLDKELKLPESLEYIILNFFLKCSTIVNTYDQCPKSKPFRCANSSKCLSLSRILDGIPDCFLGDDENITDSCSLPDVDYRFRCSSEHKCIPMSSVNNGISRCVGREDMAVGIAIRGKVKNHLFFSILCDGFVDHDLIDGLNYTDEMDCEYWPCSNVYTRCNHRATWNCRNASDEANCPSNPCRPNRHPCISLLTYNFTCLPLSRINDGHIDCLGGYDELHYCPSQSISSHRQYRCFNETKCINTRNVCDSQTDCISGDDENQWCTQLINWPDWMKKFSPSVPSDTFDLNLYLLHLGESSNKLKMVYFTLKNHRNYPDIDGINNEDNSIVTTSVDSVPSDKFTVNWDQLANYNLKAFCNRGFPVYVNNLKEHYCLCPPAYFGYQCEYQSQRVSLTLRFRTAELRTMFTFVMMLMDENANIHSSEQIDYISIRNCRKKYNFYLLYSTRPKNFNHTYYVRIDVYDRLKMKYYISMYYPIRYSFLPVYRFVLRLDIPMREVITISNNCPLKCLHGQCRYFLNSDKYFCQCVNGYSGMLCTIKNSCNCSSDSICIGVVQNRSICICPHGKFGPRCYLKSTVCISNPCLNNGRCIIGDEKFSKTEYYCLCPEGFMGVLCEINQTKIEFIFEKLIPLPQSILIHFFYVSSIPYQPAYLHLADPIRTTLISKIKSYEHSTFIYYGGTFHMIFVEFNEHRYLAFLQQNSTLAMNISITIIPQHQCASIKELLDDHIQTLPRWHRAKYYHVPCQKHSNLVCFYDNDYFMCLCDIDRHANCFKFDYKPVYNYLGSNFCTNDGQYYLDNNTCPTSSSCFCKDCYYGSRCQFTTKGFGLSLDDILGYSIWPNFSFSKQPIIVKLCTIGTILMFSIAIVNSILSIVTFQTKKSLQIGCGIYLLGSSITSLLTMTIFTIKFVLLLISQMSRITNYSFLKSNCLCLDILLRSFLAIGDWLNACVSIERTLTIRLGISFNKVKSKEIAKKIVLGIYLSVFVSFIYDPIYRRLLEEIEEQRIWCVVHYPSSVRIFATFNNVFHFIVPLTINYISTVSIIILIAQQKSKTRKQETYKQHLWQQFHKHKHRLLSSFILGIIALPRLVISLMSNCMKSARNPWLYVCSYFISFIPPSIIFILYVLPSEFYRKEFNKATVGIRKTIQTQFRCK
ncbi:unnamed protein product [Rotaria sordida]|uniref:Uncharacterized protein n=1 Tax=Rotaria sordida TaxID=392033 RepID=A0A814L0Y9_9BILA|nr:unnamed protein product [Rotaria sordida]CAF3726400.1 unnamed protein product [Rotaria sordida]CAF3818147.1 unnamed protein product [Rotaria sordida]